MQLTPRILYNSAVRISYFIVNNFVFRILLLDNFEFRILWLDNLSFNYNMTYTSICWIDSERRANATYSSIRDPINNYVTN